MMLYACSQQDASTPAPPGAHGPTRMRAAAGPATAVAAQRPDGALGTHSIATKVIYFTTWRRRPAPLRAMRESLAHPHSYPNTPDARCQKPCQHRACMDHSPRSGSHAPADLRSSPARRPHTRSSKLAQYSKTCPAPRPRACGRRGGAWEHTGRSFRAATKAWCHPGRRGDCGMEASSGRARACKDTRRDQKPALLRTPLPEGPGGPGLSALAAV